MTTASTSEVLNKAADLIEEHGWGSGPETWSAEHNKGLCLEGGILAALGVESMHDGESPMTRREFESCPAHGAVSSYLHLNDALWTWNDTVARTAEDVIGVLRATALIESARERESVEV